MDNTSNVKKKHKREYSYSEDEFLPEWTSGDFTHIAAPSDYAVINNNTDQLNRSTDLSNHGVTPREDLPCKIVVIGDAGVGKTSFVRRYISKVFTNTYRWTVGGRKSCKMQERVKFIRWKFLKSFQYGRPSWLSGGGGGGGGGGGLLIL